MVPNERNDPQYPNAWKSNGEKNGYNQKVYDLLCQSYWLIDQKIPGTNTTMQSFEKFADWLVQFAIAWGKFLDTPASFCVQRLPIGQRGNGRIDPRRETDPGNTATRRTQSLQGTG